MNVQLSNCTSSMSVFHERLNLLKFYANKIIYLITPSAFDFASSTSLISIDFLFLLNFFE